ncbi:MAG: patatin-like phospholipase family protein [Gemmatimonadaceae bacterium]|nr:patatin-like phospholipase family protein [Gemmatimonadaceae bacterium]
MSVHSRPPRTLTLRAGPEAMSILRERGLRADDVDVLPGASGGAKWLSIGGLDRYLFGTFFTTDVRRTPLVGIGSSIGSWRLACLAQSDPLAALARGHEAYIEHQRYSPNPSLDEVTRVLSACLDHMLGSNGAHAMLTHPWLHTHIITGEARGLMTSESRAALGLGLALAAAGNVISRRTLQWSIRRTVFHSGSASAFAPFNDMSSATHPLTEQIARDVLFASGSIPLLLHGVRLGDSPSVHWDGGVTDYHIDLPFPTQQGLALYPHFYDTITPGWFDKGLPWRRAGVRNFRRTLLIAPRAEFVATFPGGKIPDRQDFYQLTDSERIARWTTVNAMTDAMGEELHELIETGRVAEMAIPW